MSLARHVLLIACENSASLTRQWVLEHVGYRVTRVDRAEAAEQAMRQAAVDLALIGDHANRAEVKRIVNTVRRQSANLPIVSCSRFSGVPVSARVPPLAGPPALLRVVGEMLIQAHGHSAANDDCVLFVDQDRRYFHVTDAAAELLGYEREELLGRTIDDISAPEMDVPGKFAAYVRDGVQHGVFSLRHRNGGIVEIRYAAEVLADGCMVSRLTKMPEAANQQFIEAPSERPQSGQRVRGRTRSTQKQTPGPKPGRSNLKAG